MTSVAKDHSLMQHQPFNKIIILQIITCKFFLSYSLNYLNNITYLLNFCLLYIYTHYDLYYYDFVEWLVSDKDAACAPCVICFSVHYWLSRYVWTRSTFGLIGFHFRCRDHILRYLETNSLLQVWSYRYWHLDGERIK